MRKYFVAVTVLLLALNVCLAETYSGKFVQAKDGKITIRVLGKAENPEDLNRTYPLANNVVVRHGKLVYDKATGTVQAEEGEVIEGGLRAPLFTDPELNQHLKIGITLEDVGGAAKVTKVYVLPKKKTGNE